MTAQLDGSTPTTTPPKSTGMFDMDPTIRTSVTQAANDVSGDRNFGKQLGEQLTTKLKSEGADLQGRLAGLINKRMSDWTTSMPNWAQPLASTMFKAGTAWDKDPNFGQQIGQTIAKPGSPFAEGVSGELSSLITPENLSGVINKTQFTGPAKSMLNFMGTGNLSGKGGLMSDIFGKDYWGAITGEQDATKPTA